MSWYLYILKCADETLYSGITTDLDRRTDEHNTSAKGARYTRARRPVVLVAAWTFDDRSTASRAEYAVKKLSRTQKFELLGGSSSHAGEFLTRPVPAEDLPR